MSAPETTPVLAPLLPRLRAERAIEAAAASAARPLEARGVELEIGLPDGARAPPLTRRASSSPPCAPCCSPSWPGSAS